MVPLVKFPVLYYVLSLVTLHAFILKQLINREGQVDGSNEVGNGSSNYGIGEC